MAKQIMLSIVIVLLSCISTRPEAPVHMGVTLQPFLIQPPGKCFHVSQAGYYEIEKGGLIELELSVPVVPGCPQDYTVSCTNNGAITWSTLGTRLVNPDNIGASNLRFYFKAKQKGKYDIVTIIVGGWDFEYTIMVN